MFNKSLFMGLYPVFSLGLFALPFLDQQGSVWLVCLAIIAATPFPLFIGKLYLYQTARTSKNLDLIFQIPLISFVFSLVSIWMMDLDSSQYVFSLIATAGSLIGNLAYVFWYSRFGRKYNPVLEVGRKLPSFLYWMWEEILLAQKIWVSNPA